MIKTNWSKFLRAAADFVDLWPSDLPKKKINNWWDENLNINKADKEQISFKEIIEYFTENKPQINKDDAQGALLRHKNPNEIILLQVFLNPENNKPLKMSNGQLYGQKITCQTLDTELEDAFGDKDILIVG